MVGVSLVCAGALVPSRARAVRVWEEPRAGWVPPAGTLSGGPSLVELFSGSVASPDLRLPDFTPPLAAGGHVGASRFPEGVAERWLDIGFFAQPQLQVMTGFDADAATNFSFPPGVSLRRARVVIHGQAHPLLQVRLEFNLSDRLELFDAYALVPIRRWLQLQIGQFRVPFSRQELVSGSRLQFIDTALWSAGANLGGYRHIPSFDMGLMAWGWVGPRDLFEYYVGVFNGEGPNQPSNLDGFFLGAARVVLNPLGRPRNFQESAVGLPRAPSVSIGLNGTLQKRQIGVVMRPSGPIPNRIDLIALGADVSFTGWGASFYGEVYARDQEETDTMAAPNTQSFGWLAQAGYFIPAPYVRDHLEVVARVQSFNPSDCFTRTVGSTCGIREPASPTREVYRDFMHTLAITFGANWYQLGHGLKVQAAYTIHNELRDISGRGPGSGIVRNDLFNLQLTGSF